MIVATAIHPNAVRVGTGSSPTRTGLKFRYSEKATKICPTYQYSFGNTLVVSNYKWKMSQIFVPFSEYPNFKMKIRIGLKMKFTVSEDNYFNCKIEMKSSWSLYK